MDKIKKDRVDKYCSFLDIHRKIYCNKKVQSEYNYDYCVTLSELYSDCTTVYIRPPNK